MYSKNPNAAINRRLEKEVISSRLIHSLDTTQGLNITGPGSMEATSELTYNSSSVLKVTYPNIVYPLNSDGRSYGCTRVRLDFNREDWSEYNRISFWAYPEKNGFDSASILMEYISDGENPFPNHNYFLSGCHSAKMTVGKWNHIIWEIPELPRNSVTMFQLNFVSNGMQKNMKPESKIYLSNLEIQKVKPDKYTGWETDGKISFCHSGYAPNDRKQAVASVCDENNFFVIEYNSKKSVFIGKIEKLKNDMGCFAVLDFSEFSAEGTYCLKYGDTVTPPFIISQNHWDSVIDKLRNFFSKERCGCTVEDVHLPCHENMFVQHSDGRKLSVAGGWHDAADLSQGLCNTAEAVHSFLDISESIKSKKPKLSENFKDEAKYGLEWMLGTRFEDGYRCIWNTSGIWTLGSTDGEDSIVNPAERKPFECLCACAAEAAAYNVYRDTEPMFADYCLKYAKEDFEFALIDFDPDDTTKVEAAGSAAAVQLYAEASFSASVLYKATLDKKYLDYAVKFADYILACQQTTPTNWEIPFVGFFYEDSTKTTPLTYDHRAHDQVIIMALAELLKNAPENKKSALWQTSLELYREYIKKLLEFSKPYNFLPAGIYFLNAPAALTGSGDHKKARFSGEIYKRLLESGIKLNDGVYLRRMPVVKIFRGSYGVLLSKAKAVSALGLALKDNTLLEVAKQQIAWILGNNPFSCSFMYGEGYDFPDMNTVSNSFNVDGQLPVGLNSFEDTDMPYMPMTNQATYFEVWVHPASRMLWTLSDLEQD